MASLSLWYFLGGGFLLFSPCFLEPFCCYYNYLICFYFFFISFSFFFSSLYFSNSLISAIVKAFFFLLLFLFSCLLLSASVRGGLSTSLSFSPELLPPYRPKSFYFLCLDEVSDSSPLPPNKPSIFKL